MKLHCIKKILLIVVLGGFCVPAQAMWQGAWDSTKKIVQKHPYVVGALGFAGLSYGVYKIFNNPFQALIEDIELHRLTPEQAFKRAVDKNSFEEADKVARIYKLYHSSISCFQQILFELASNHKHPFLKILLESGLVDVNLCGFYDKEGVFHKYVWTPLTFCIGSCEDKYGHVFFVPEDRIKSLKLLLDHGAQIDARGLGSGQPIALHRAVWIGALDVVRLLLEYGADYKVLDGFQQTALDYITSDTNQEIVDLLVMVSGVEHEHMDYRLTIGFAWYSQFCLQNTINSWRNDINSLQNDINSLQNDINSLQNIINSFRNNINSLWNEHDQKTIYMYTDEQYQRIITMSSSIPAWYPQLLTCFGFLKIEDFGKVFDGKTVDLMMRLRNTKALELVMPLAITSGNSKVFEETAQKLHCKPLKFEIEQIILKTKNGYGMQLKLVHLLKHKKLVDTYWRFK